MTLSFSGLFSFLFACLLARCFTCIYFGIFLLLCVPVRSQTDFTSLRDILRYFLLISLLPEITINATANIRTYAYMHINLFIFVFIWMVVQAFGYVVYVCMCLCYAFQSISFLISFHIHVSRIFPFSYIDSFIGSATVLCHHPFVRTHSHPALHWYCFFSCSVSVQV